MASKRKKPTARKASPPKPPVYRLELSDRQALWLLEQARIGSRDSNDDVATVAASVRALVMAEDRRLQALAQPKEQQL